MKAPRKAARIAGTTVVTLVPDTSPMLSALGMVACTVPFLFQDEAEKRILAEAVRLQNSIGTSLRLRPATRL
jgi:hypothetical protein